MESTPVPGIDHCKFLLSISSVFITQVIMLLMALAPSTPVSVLVFAGCSVQFSPRWDGTGSRAHQDLCITHALLTGQEHFPHSQSSNPATTSIKIISSQGTGHMSVLKTALTVSVQRCTSWFTSPDWNYPEKKKCT